MSDKKLVIDILQQEMDGDLPHWLSPEGRNGGNVFKVPADGDDEKKKRPKGEKTEKRWNEADHPRNPAGSGDDGGEFTAGGGGGGASSSDSSSSPAASPSAAAKTAAAKTAGNDPGHGESKGSTVAPPSDEPSAAAQAASIPLDRSYVRPKVTKVATIDEAVDRVLRGEVVELENEGQVNTLVDKLAAMAADAKARGEAAPDYDLCLSGDTRVITWDGNVPIASLAGQRAVLLSRHAAGSSSRWVEAEVRSFGVQELRKVTIRRHGIEKVIYATGNHRWLVRSSRTAHGEAWTTTDHLQPKNAIPCVFAAPNKKQSWVVVSVEHTDRREEVFCATVPETGCFVLEDNVLTGNCGVTVKGTNLFCASIVTDAEHPNGWSRIEMPQMGGKPVAGSEADKLPRFPHTPDEVDGAEHFVSTLQQMGISVTNDVVPAASLKAAQRELIGPKVASMARNRSFDPAKNPLFVSRDGYVVDGHHRWAAIVLRDVEDGKLGDLNVPVRRVDAPISEVLKIANAWGVKFGIAQAHGVVKRSLEYMRHLLRTRRASRAAALLSSTRSTAPMSSAASQRMAPPVSPRRTEVQRHYEVADLQVRAAPRGGGEFPAGVCGQITGTILVYGVPDAYGTLFVKGCLDRSRKEKIGSGKVKLFADHGPFTDTHVGVVRSIEDRGDSAIMVADIFDTEAGRRLKEYLGAVVAAGSETGLSVGFVPRKKEWRAATGRNGGLPGEQVCYFEEIELRECSITPVPAVPGTTVTSVRSEKSAARRPFGPGPKETANTSGDPKRDAARGGKPAGAAMLPDDEEQQINSQGANGGAGEPPNSQGEGADDGMTQEQDPAMATAGPGAPVAAPGATGAAGVTGAPVAGMAGAAAPVPRVLVTVKVDDGTGASGALGAGDGTLSALADPAADVALLFRALEGILHALPESAARAIFDDVYSAGRVDKVNGTGGIASPPADPADERTAEGDEPDAIDAEDTGSTGDEAASESKGKGGPKPPWLNKKAKAKGAPGADDKDEPPLSQRRSDSQRIASPEERARAVRSSLAYAESLRR